MSENPNFLKNKYNLHTSEEVLNAKKRTESQTGEKVKGDPESMIQNYLDRLEGLVLDPDKKQSKKTVNAESRPRALSLLREMVMDKYVRPHKEKMAENAARVEERAARTLGIEAQYGQEELAERGEIAVTDVEKSLDGWISYLSDANEPYPTWFRYYAFRNILDMGDYDKDKGEFTKRSPGTVRLFPDIDRGALAYVQQMIEADKNPEILEKLRKAQKSAALENIPEDQLITKEKVANFAKLSFAKQYTEAIKQSGEITPEMREETRGEWKKYQKDTDPTALWASLQNKGTAWCTKGFGTAQTQLKGGDFYVYYTFDKQGKPTIPRIAIRMQGKDIGEVRGVSDNDQNLEGNMVDIAQKKMNELPGAEKYIKKSADMKLLTQIDKKTKNNEELNKDELTFLYEIDRPIQGFGYDDDPRIKEIRDTRNKDRDILIIFDYEPNQVAHNQKEINENTKAYVGELFPNIFQVLQTEHIYTEFPEGKIRRYNIEIGGKNKDELEEEMKKQNIVISDWAQDVFNSPDFTTSKTKQNETLIRLKVADLKTKNQTTDEIFAKAKELGLELCPPETGPNFRLQNQTREYIVIGMKQIADSVRHPRVFTLRNSGDALWLDSNDARPDFRWYDYYGFVFSLRPPEAGRQV
ncbi:MAG TPA: hypothetical protein P5230_02935 [Candidatus Magasanikbacteria bacterium]|nr:hypothetical protein [Candidatus Magasanikbacteria bacterium]